MEFVENAEMIIALLTGLLGLVSAAIGVYFAVKAWAEKLKDKSTYEIWGMIMEVADKAMEEAERSGASGAEKKAMVIDIVKASTLAAGIDITAFLDQLSSYIDQTIEFFNKMQNK
jgi:hypothetical protein